MGKIISLLAALLAASGLFAETAEIRTHSQNGAVESKTVKLEKIGADKFRLAIPKSDIGKDAKFIDIVAEFAKADKGDAGYWIMPRGTYGNFDKDNGIYRRGRQLMPIFGMKRGEKMFWGHMKTYRFDYEVVVEVKKGKYEIFPRITLDTVRKFFEPYDDVVVEFNMLSGKDADYNGMAKAYQKYQLDQIGRASCRERV